MGLGRNYRIMNITVKLSYSIGRFLAIALTLFCSGENIVKGQSNCAILPTGALSWWRCESDARDEVGASHGTNVGNIVFGSGKVGQAFTLDGIADAVSVGNPTNLQLQTLTIEAWIKRAHPSRATQGAQTSGYVFSGTNGAYGFGLLDDGRLFLSKLGVNAVFSTAVVTDTNNFHHVAMTKSGSDVMLYIDGAGESVGPYDPGFVFNGPMAIGARGGDYASSFFGNIDEITIYNRALASNEIQSIYIANNIGKCLLSPIITTHPKSTNVIVGANVEFLVIASGSLPLNYQWRFNNTNIAGATSALLTLTNAQTTNTGIYSVVVSNSAGTAISSNASLTVSLPQLCVNPVSGLISWWRSESNALDSVGGNHGTLQNQTTYGSGKVGAAFVFDGSRDGVQLGNPTNLHLQTFTIEGWIKRSNASDSTLDGHPNGALLHYGLGGYGFAIHDNGRLLLTKVGASAIYSTQTVQNVSLHHVAVTKDGGTVRFYVDGVGETASFYDPGFTFGSSVGIGAQGGDMDASFYGSIDELSVYNRALETNEIKDIYDAGTYGKCGSAMPPFIIAHPVGANVIFGTNVAFSVSAGGSTPLTYQWRFNGTNIAGATDATLALTNVQFTH
jgi:hypothetical protein